MKKLFLLTAALALALTVAGCTSNQPVNTSTNTGGSNVSTTKNSILQPVTYQAPRVSNTTSSVTTSVAASTPAPANTGSGDNLTYSGSDQQRWTNPAALYRAPYYNYYNQVTYTEPVVTRSNCAYTYYWNGYSCVHDSTYYQNSSYYDNGTYCPTGYFYDGYCHNYSNNYYNNGYNGNCSNGYYVNGVCKSNNGYYDASGTYHPYSTGNCYNGYYNNGYCQQYNNNNYCNSGYYSNGRCMIYDPYTGTYR